MIGKALGAVHEVDAWLRRMLGRPYHAALGIGLILEIIARVRELIETPGKSLGMVRLALVMLLFVLLLIHQLGELSDHAGRRRGALEEE
jgi:hypothetical protein